MSVIFSCSDEAQTVPELIVRLGLALLEPTNNTGNPNPIVGMAGGHTPPMYAIH